MTPAEVKDAYRRALGEFEPILIRRYAGAGASRPHFDAQAQARVMGYEPHELVGNIEQGDRRLIVLAEDLIDAQFALPVTTNDKVVVRGKELQIMAMDDSTRRLGTTLIALEIQARGPG